MTQSRTHGVQVCGDGVAKLTDFGLSSLIVDLSPVVNAEGIGAIRWKAPEILSGESNGSFASDVYSFGMTIIEITTQMLPWGMMADVAVRHKVANLRELPQQPAEMSDLQWSLIKRMCSADQTERIDMACWHRSWTSAPWLCELRLTRCCWRKT